VIVPRDKRSGKPIFDEIFDDVVLANADSGQDAAQNIVNDVAKEMLSQVEPPSPVDLDKIREEAFQLGLAKGRAEQFALEQEREGLVIEQIVDPIISFLSSQDELAEHAAVQVRDLLSQIMSVVLPTFVKRHGIGELPAFVDALKPVLRAERCLTITANSETIEALRQQIGNHSAATVSWQTSSAVANGDLTVSWATGSAERNAGDFLDRISKLLDTSNAGQK